MKTCEKCGHENDDAVKFCVQCGSPLPEKPAEAETEQKRLHFCPKCGEPIEEPDPTYCCSCGAYLNNVACGPLPGGEMPAYCPSCGAVCYVSDAYCYSCGRELEPRESGAVIAEPRKGSSDDAGNVGVRPEPQPEPKKPRRRRRRVAVAATLAVVLVACVAGAGLWLHNGGLPAENTVYYGKKGTVKVSSKARITPHDDKGEPLTDYGLTLMDDKGDITTYQVSGGGFVPEDMQLDAGEYALTIKDEDQKEVYNVPKLEIVPEDEAKDDDEVIQGDVSIKPEEPVTPEEPGDGAEDGADDSDDDGADEDETAMERQIAFGMYWDKINELRGQYGDVDLAGDGTKTGFNYLTGLCMVRPVDFDADGIEELVVVYKKDGVAKPKNTDGYVVEVWQYQPDSPELKLVFTGKPSFTNAGFFYIDFMVSGDDKGGKPTLLVSEYSGGLGTTTDTSMLSYIGDCDGKGLQAVTLSEVDTKSVEGDATAVSSEYSIDGKVVSETEFESTYNQWLKATQATESVYWFVGNDTVKENPETGNHYAPSDVPNLTQRAIDQIKRGMMGEFDDIQAS